MEISKFFIIYTIFTTQCEAEKPSENLWGEMESESDSSEDDSEEDESEEEGDQDGTGVPTIADPATIDNGLVTPSGMTSQGLKITFVPKISIFLLKILLFG